MASASQGSPEEESRELHEDGDNGKTAVSPW